MRNLVPDAPSQPTHEGRIVQHFSTNVDPNRMVPTSTLGIHGVGSDGATVRFHEVTHIRSGMDGGPMSLIGLGVADYRPDDGFF